MPDAVADTHSLIWYLEDDPRLGPAARAVFDACDRGQDTVYIPTICLVEIVYLCEKGRIPTDFKARLDTELATESSGLRLVDLTQHIVETLAHVPRTLVPEMPDRIIAATALDLRLPLISRDHRIRATDITTIW